MRMTGAALLILMVAFAALTFGMRTYNSAKHRIDTPSGVDTSEYLVIGGIEQYVRIRGEDSANPVILFLHGGPGLPTAIFSHLWYPFLQADYTMVDWDQRGSGNTYYRNGGECGEITFEQLTADIDEIVDVLCERFDQEKVIILGHSFGTEIGIRYAAAHPEKVSHYIGVGQVADEHVLLKEQIENASEKARAAGDEDTAEEMEKRLQALLEAFNTTPSDASDAVNGALLLEMEDLQDLAYEYLPGGKSYNFADALFSPRLTWYDVRWFALGGAFTNKARSGMMQLYRQEYFSERSSHKPPVSLSVPVTFITGLNDWITPYMLADDYLGTLDAPYRKMVSFPDAGHRPMLDDPEAFASALKGTLEEAA